MNWNEIMLSTLEMVRATEKNLKPESPHYENDIEFIRHCREQIKFYEAHGGSPLRIVYKAT